MFITRKLNILDLCKCICVYECMHPCVGIFVSHISHDFVTELLLFCFRGATILGVLLQGMRAPLQCKYGCTRTGLQGFLSNCCLCICK